MVNKATEGAKPFENGQEQAGVMLGMQREVLEACDQASRAWLERVKSEVELWTGLAAKLSATRSLPEAIGNLSGLYDALDADGSRDGRRMSDDCQKLLQRFSRPLPNGWPTGST